MQTQIKIYDNLIEVLTGLKKGGYVEGSSLKQNCIECRDGMCGIFHNEFNIDNYFRFEDDDSSLDNSAILYAITSEEYNLKGRLFIFF